MLIIYPPTKRRLGSVSRDWFLMNACGNPHWKSSTKPLFLTLIQFKVFRCHYLRTKLAQIFPNMVDVGGGSSCNLTHMFFSCQALTNFWQIYLNTMSKVLSRTIHTSPHTGIFGLPEDYTLYFTKKLEVIAFTSVIAKRHLLLNWKSTTAPASTWWIKETVIFESREN